jgi:hypothetical protein
MCKQRLDGRRAAEPHRVVQRRYAILIRFLNVGPDPKEPFDGRALPIGIGILLAANVG